MRVRDLFRSPLGDAAIWLFALGLAWWLLSSVPQLRELLFEVLP